MASNGVAAGEALQVLGTGNPLLDMTATVPLEFMEKYNLRFHETILAEPHQLPLYEEMEKKYQPVQLSPGGATLNSIRVCNALFGHTKGKSPDVCSYMGCVGKDAHGDQLQKLLKEIGISAIFDVSEKSATGVCGVCIYQKDRTMLTHLAAANDFKKQFIETPEAVALIKRSSVFYSAGYFLTVSPDTMIEIGKHYAQDMSKIFCTGISAPFLLEPPFGESFLKLMPYVDVMFGNEIEFNTFGKLHKCGDTIAEVAIHISKLEKVNKKKSRVVICTQGHLDTIVAISKYDEATGSHQVETFSYPVEPLADKEVVDLNAAGDAFIGGYLYGLSLKLDVSSCVYYAHFAARHVIQRYGCTFDFDKSGPPPVPKSWGPMKI